jgi:NADH-quinone oxidoreductase subunit J
LALGQPHAGTILRALVILALGGAGVYLMLPRGQPAGRRLERYLGGALATVALVLIITTPISSLMDGLENSQATILWELNDQPAPTCYTFHLLAFVSLGSAIMMITSRNPVYSALWFAIVLLGNSGLFLIQKAEFLSAASIIVYAGAIVVTFLFVIMLAQPTGTARYDRHSREPLLVAATGLVLASVLVGTLHYSARFEGWGEGKAGSFRPPVGKIVDDYGKEPRIGDQHVAGLGKTLFVDHVASVEVIGILLLAAVVGAMLIAGHKVEEPARREKSG